MELPTPPDPEREGLTVRRILLLTLVAFVACWPDSPVAPERDGIQVGGPRFSFTGGTGKVLGSTNQGELVEIDLDAGTVTLIGDAGVFAGDTVLWTDITFDGSGNLFGLSRSFSESDFEVHLYEIDSSSGAVIADVGGVGDQDMLLTDFDFDGSAFYGGGRDSFHSCCGRLFSINSTNAQVTWISSDTLGFGLNPYDSLFGEPAKLQSGGFAVHPVTGDLWVVESLQRGHGLLFRVDQVTGLADSILVTGPPEYGYDALHILDDGTFIATRGGPDTPPDSVLWEISSMPDSNGVVAIALIPLTVDPAIVGNLNGLEAMGAQQGPLVLSLTADTTELHPWLPELTVNGHLQSSRPGDTASFTITTILGSSPEDVAVDVWAEYLPDTGGHAHQTMRVAFDDVPLAYDNSPNSRPFYYDLLDNPWTGFFNYNSTTAPSFSANTSAGQLEFTFQAGTIGGQVEVIAEAEFGGQLVADTVVIDVRVPGLINARTDPTDGVTGVYWVGWTAAHPVDTNWFMASSAAQATQAVVDEMTQEDAGSGYFLQLNDATLPFGGTFTVEPVSGVFGEDPFEDDGHLAHDSGIDVDLGWCYVTTSQYDPDQTARIEGTDCSATKAVDEFTLNRASNAAGGCNRVHAGNHYHIRFDGACQ